MDYGRIAYMKTEDLEKRLSVKRETVYNAVNLTPRSSLYRDFRLAIIGGTGEALLFIKCRFENDNPMLVSREAEAVLTLGGSTVNKTRIAFSPDSGIASTDIIVPVGLDGDSELTVKAIDKCRLIGAEIACIGGTVTKSGELCGDGGRESFIVLSSDYNDCTLYGVAEGKRVESFFDYGVSCDAVKLESGYAAVICDEYGNLNGYIIGEDLKVVKRVHLGIFGGAAAVTRLGNRLMVATADGVGVETFFTDLSFSGSTGRTPLAHTRGSVGVRFVKGADRPYLIVNTPTHAYLRCGDRQFSFSSVRGSRSAAEITAVTD